LPRRRITGEYPDTIESAVNLWTAGAPIPEVRRSDGVAAKARRCKLL